jgi:hypothetical protein
MIENNGSQRDIHVLRSEITSIAKSRNNRSGEVRSKNEENTVPISVEVGIH